MTYCAPNAETLTFPHLLFYLLSLFLRTYSVIDSKDFAEHLPCSLSGL